MSLTLRDRISASFDVLRAFLALHGNDPGADIDAVIDHTFEDVMVEIERDGVVARETDGEVTR